MRNIGVYRALSKAKASEGFYHGRSGFNDTHKGGTGTVWNSGRYCSREADKKVENLLELEAST